MRLLSNILLALLIPLSINAQTTRRVDGHIAMGVSAKKNYIKNAQLEQNDNDITDASGIASFSVTTPLDGAGSLLIDSTANGQKVCFSTFTREPGIYGQLCTGTIRYNGDASTYTLSVEQGGSILGSAVALTNAGTSSATGLLPDFACGVAATGANTICINSTANGAAIRVDDVHLELSPTNALVPASSGQSINVQNITATGSFVVPAGVTSVFYKICGAGGGGGGQPVSTNAGGGGGGGGQILHGSMLVTPAETLTATIGAAGTAGSESDGGDGGTTSIAGGSVTVSAYGGGGGGRNGTAGRTSGSGWAGGAANSGGGGGGCGDGGGYCIGAASGSGGSPGASALWSAGGGGCANSGGGCNAGSGGKSQYAAGGAGSAASANRSGGGGGGGGLAAGGKGGRGAGDNPAAGGICAGGGGCGDATNTGCTAGAGGRGDITLYWWE